MKRKILQFGDQIGETFVFPPYEEEDDWGDEVNPVTLGIPFTDGAYRALGFDQSKKGAKTLTKRFVLYSPEYAKAYQAQCDLRYAYTTDLIDYMYRTLRGGVKRLYAVMEDGTLRWTYAEAVSIPYSASFSEPKGWHAFTVDFLLHDPYWYEVNDGQTLYFDNLPITALVQHCPDLSIGDILDTYEGSKVFGLHEFCVITQCKYNGAVLRDSRYVNFVNETCNVSSCMVDPGFWSVYGDGYECYGTTEIELCVKGSAGATSPKISFRGEFNSPKILNDRNGDYVQYLGNLTANQFLTIDLASAINGDIEDYDIDTNIPGFSRSKVSVSMDGYFKLLPGKNTLTVTGGQDPLSKLTMKYMNIYHN